MARVISVTDGIIGVSLFIFLLVPFLGMTGVWLAQLFGNLFCTLVVFTCAWVYNKKPPFSFDRMMCLPKGFGVPDENRIDISIHSIDEVINISERVWDFCLNHGVSRRSTYCASLCVEEMAGNIVLHGFDGRQDRNLDARVSLIRDEVVISLKDDCKAFNPTEAAKIFDPDDITHNIGLRLAAAISGEMSYQNTFGLNVLTIRIG